MYINQNLVDFFAQLGIQDYHFIWKMQYDCDSLVLTIWTQYERDPIFQEEVSELTFIFMARWVTVSSKETFRGFFPKEDLVLILRGDHPDTAEMLEANCKRLLLVKATKSKRLQTPDLRKLQPINAGQKAF